MRHVLIVDDSLTVRMDLDQTFRDAGWATTLCSTAGAARQALGVSRFDVIVLDVLLPDGNGLKLLQEIKEPPSTAASPVILLSSQAEVAAQDEGRSVQADDYVDKPYDRADLLARADRLARTGGRPASPSAGEAAAEAPPGNQGTRKILAVDDSPTYLYALAEHLREDDYEVITAHSGPQALELLRSTPVDCILLDLIMPGMPGQETCRKIRSIPAWQSIPVVMLTGREDHQAMIDSFNAGADDYVPKSSDFAVLRARLRAQLRRRQADEENQRIREQLHRQEIEVAEARAAHELAAARAVLLADLQRKNAELEETHQGMTEAQERVRWQNAILEGINRVFREGLLGQTEGELAGACLAVAEHLTASKFSFMTMINPQTGLLDDIAISAPGWELCQMGEPSGHGPTLRTGFAIRGIHGRVVLDGKGFFTNDPPLHPDSVGVPVGHPPLTAFLGVPLTYGGDTIGVVGLANREGGYSAGDLAALEALAPAMVQVLMRRRAEEALRLSNQSLEQRVTERTAQLQERAVQLRRLASELAQTEQRERRRLAEILHDHLQQLLVGAKFSVSILRSRLGDQEDRQHLEQVDDLLDQSVTTSRSLTVELSPPVLSEGSLGGALRWLANWMREKHGLEVQVHADEAINPDEEIRAMLFQCVRELLFNVVKHAKVSAASIAMEPCCNEQLRIIVADKGTGFEPGTRRDHADASTGLGLFSMHERLEVMGGNLVMESAPGKGTRMTLVAPLHLPETEPTVTAAETSVAFEAPVAEPGRPHRPGCIRVLVADDHAVVRDGLTRLLATHADIEVIGTAADGQQAIDQALRLQPDVVLMDISMPRLSGIEATRQLRAQMPEVCIIGLSMHAEDDVMTRMREAGARHYLTKSAPPEEVIATIRGCPRGPME